MSVDAVSAGRVLICSRDPRFTVSVGNYLSKRDFDVIPCRGFPSPPWSADLTIADIDGLPLMWWKSLTGQRVQDRSVPLILVGSGWPNFARLHSWRPCGYVRKPFSMADLMRVVRDLVPGVQASHRRIEDTDGRSPAARAYGGLEGTITESAA